MSSAPQTRNNMASLVLPPAIRLLRPKQWTKGLLVFAALLFSRGYTDSLKSEKVILAFISMALVSSAVYILNDLLDVDRDRAHPTKRSRPIASGEVGIPVAIALLLTCAFVGVGSATYLGKSSLAIIGFYILLQVAYNFGLKRMPVADVFCLSMGFVLRAILGAAAIHVGISGWLLFCTGSLALLLAFGKRRHEWILQGEDRASSREALAGYNQQSLESLVVLAAGCAAMSYGIYSIESPTAKQFPPLMITSVFVFFGVFRYVYLLFSENEGGEPESLLFKDPQLVFSVIGFLVSAVLAMSGIRVSILEVTSS